MSSFPQVFRVRQRFDGPRIDDIPATVEAELSRLQLHNRIRPGQSVAVTVGSRGIANIDIITKALVGHLKRLDARPFIVPAMGSHGGGTAEGQRAIVEGYGVTEEFVGCPIRSSMETVVVCQTAEGIPVHFDKNAYGADHVFVCGRIKPHTGFVGDIESGLMKMMLIGLGKHNGAKIYHRAITDLSFPQIVRSVAGHVLAKCRIVAGLGIIENGYDETAKIAAVPAAEIEAREKELLVLAKKWMPRLPFDEAHILVIDEIGKNISGSGMDTNVVGRKYNDRRAEEFEYPKIKRIVVRGLTEETHGNACGIGMADFCTTRCVEQIDQRITAINTMTGGHPSAAMIPIHFDTDRQVLEGALSVVGLVEPADARLMWIPDTLHLAEVECSDAYWNQAREREDLTILIQPRPLEFDDTGNLVHFESAVTSH